MAKKNKKMSILESNLEKWANEETARLAAKGKDDRFCIVTYNKMNKGTIHGGDYTMKFNRDECVIDLVINGEKNSSIWDDVVNNVPARFAAFLTGDPKNFLIGKPENFLYRISSNTSEEKKFYYFESTDDESGELLPISIDELNPLAAHKAENFDSLISSMYNIF